jgi:hypothetical protein
VVLRSEIPREHALKEPIETSLLTALEGVPGAWSVDVATSPEGARWQVILRGRESVLRLSLPTDQLSPEKAFEAVRDALGRGGLAR